MRNSIDDDQLVLRINGMNVELFWCYESARRRTREECQDRQVKDVHNLQIVVRKSGHGFEMFSRVYVLAFGFFDRRGSFSPDSLNATRSATFWLKSRHYTLLA